MWWPAIGVCYVGAMVGLCLCNNCIVSLFLFLTLPPSVTGFVELSATLHSELVCFYQQAFQNYRCLLTIKKSITDKN